MTEEGGVCIDKFRVEGRGVPRLQKSPYKQKNYTPVGFSDRHGHPCSNPQEFLPLTRYGQKYSLEMQH